MSAPGGVILESLILINNTVSSPADGWWPFSALGPVKNLSYCSLKCGHLLLGSGREADREERFHRESMWPWDGDVTDSEWDVGELWKERLGVRRWALCRPWLLCSLDDRRWPGVSEGWSRRGNHFDFFPHVYSAFVKPLINHIIDWGVFFWVIYSAILWVNVYLSFPYLLVVRAYLEYSNNCSLQCCVSFYKK